MKKRVNTTIAKSACRFNGCNEVADVRRMKDHERGALYLVCPEHGVDKGAGAKAQEHLNGWIKNNTIIEDDNSENIPPQVSEIPQEIKPIENTEEPVKALDAQEQEQVEKPQKQGFLKTASAQFSEWFGD